MPDRRPPGDPWADAMSQVEDALAEAGVETGDHRDALMDGVRHALDMLSVGGGPSEDDGFPLAAPEVVVVDGGRGAADPPSPSEPPHLRVAPPHLRVATDSEIATGSQPAPGESAPLDSDAGVLSDAAALGASGAGQGHATRVVVRVAERVSTAVRADRGAASHALIALEPGETTQTVFRGPTPRAYRLCCSSGALQVTLDGAPVDTLPAGRAMDVEACVIQVSALGTSLGAGSFLRLPTEVHG